MNAKILILLCLSGRNCLPPMSLFALTGFLPIAFSRALKRYLKTTAWASWCCERSQPLHCRVCDLGNQAAAKAQLWGSIVPTDHDKVQKALFSTVWISFTIVCVSVSWKYKQSCNLHMVEPWMDANFLETTYLLFTFSLALSCMGTYTVMRTSPLQGYR